MRTPLIRITTRTMMLVVVFAAAIVMHLQYVYFENRWADFRQEAENRATREQSSRQSAQYCESMASRLQRPFASLGDYLLAFPASNCGMPDEELAWLRAEGDVFQAPPPAREFLKFEEMRFRDYAQWWLQEAEAAADQRRAWLRRWW
jgi:hypothetical protein